MKPHSKLSIDDLAPGFDRDRKLLFSILVIGVVAVVASWVAVRKAEYWLLEKEALASAVKWASFVRENISDLDQHLNGLPIEADDRRVYEFASKAGHVFRYKLFGPDGLVVFASRAGDIGKTTTKPYFSDLVMKGRTYVKIADREDFGADRTVVSEAYVPIMEDGRFRGAIEVYVDMTSRAIAFRRTGNLALLGLLVFLGVIGSVCGVFVWHNIRARNQDLDEVIRSRQEVLEAKATVQRSEQELRAIFETVADGIITTDKIGIVRSYNPAAERIFGFSPEDVIGQSINMLMPDQYSRLHDGYMSRYRENGESSVIGVTRELTGRRKDGATFPMELAINEKVIAGERVFTGIVRDIAEHKRAEEALRESEALFQAILDYSPAKIHIKDTEGRYTVINRQSEILFGVIDEEARGKTSAEIFSKLVAHSFMEHDRAVLETGRALEQEEEWLREDGVHTFLTVKFPILDAGGSIVGTGAIGTDITDRKRAEEELRARAYQQGVVVDLGQHALAGNDVSELMDQTVTLVAQTLGVEYCKVLELLPDGGALVLRAGTGWSDGLVGHATVSAGTDSQAGFTLLSSEPVIVEDLRTETRFSGPPLLEDHGVVSGMSVIIQDRDRPFGVLGAHTATLRRFTEADIQFLQAVANVLSAAIERKASEEERDRLADQFNQAQKMEAIGTLAGGVAHDFNNILGIIMGNADVVAMDLPEDNPAHAGLTEILKASQRAKDLVQQILTFSRQDDRKLKPVRIDRVVEETLGMMRATLPSTIEFRQRLESASPTVVADPTQIQQVIVNICVNADHAIGGQSGVLEIVLEDVEIDGGCAEGLASGVERRPDKIFRTSPSDDGRSWRLWAGLLRRGPHVKLTVSDTGCGMDGATLSRMFDPFFTTKDVGEGTGLGMATVHAIVIGHGGAIVVETAPDEGTVFHIYLPRAETNVGADVAGAACAPLGNERVLLVDDEEALVQVSARMLESFGYRVDGMTDSLAALNAFRARPGHWDLVITDQTMSSLTGTSLARELLRARADIPIILCTGFKKAMGEETLREIGIREILMKPMRGDELARAVRRTLDGD